ncbi:hypothetical protein EXS56_02810 [Candidatus Kaiserbacteria bacterium]|nr:hypothetical protein [Candidatus Kaiserbacteria bacterium]
MEAGKNIAFAGFMGAGKDEVGLRVADTLGLDFFAIDKIFVKRHGPIENILNRNDDSAFRVLERKILSELLAMKDTVISLGGGTLVNAFNGEPNYEDALERCVVVWLEVDFDVAKRRVENDPKKIKRPLFDKDARARFDLRQPLYDKAAHIIVDANRPIEDVVADVMKAIEKHSNS